VATEQPWPQCSLLQNLVQRIYQTTYTHTCPFSGSSTTLINWPYTLEIRNGPAHEAGLALTRERGTRRPGEWTKNRELSGTAESRSLLNQPIQQTWVHLQLSLSRASGQNYLLPIICARRVSFTQVMGLALHVVMSEPSQVGSCMALNVKGCSFSLL